MSVSAVGSTPVAPSYEISISVQVEVVPVQASQAPTVSQGATLLSQLQDLAKTDPDRFKAVMSKVADELRAEAQQASGGRAVLLSALADRFAAAAQAGDLSPLEQAQAPSADASSSPAGSAQTATSSGSAATDASSSSAASSQAASSSGSAAAPSGSSDASAADGSGQAAAPVRHHHRHHHRHARGHYGSDSSAGAWSANGIVSHVAELVADALRSVTEQPATTSAPAAAAA